MSHSAGRRRHRIPVLGLALGLGLVLLPGPPPAAADEELRGKRHRGKIVAYDRAADTIDVRTRMGVHRFDLGPRLRVYSKEGEVSADALAVGQLVTLRAEDDQGREWRTSYVQIVDGAELVGQIEEWPAAALADTATVVSTDSETGLLVVDGDDGRRRYRVDERTRIWRGGRRVALASLEAGERVTVTAEEPDSPDEGRSALVATHVVVVRDPQPQRAQQEEK